MTGNPADLERLDPAEAWELQRFLVSAVRQMGRFTRDRQRIATSALQLAHLLDISEDKREEAVIAALVRVIEEQDHAVTG